MGCSSRSIATAKLETLAALCTALECTPNDLLEIDTTPVAAPKPAAKTSPARRAAGGGGRRGRTPPLF
jgi:putative transcriptional regulator